MSRKSRMTGAFYPVLIVMIAGACTGVMWKQGWFPFELLPVPAGVIDQVAEDEQPLPFVPASVAPLATHPHDKQQAIPTQAPVASEIDASIFHQQTEPDLSSPPVKPYRRTADFTDAAVMTRAGGLPPHQKTTGQEPEFVDAAVMNAGGAIAETPGNSAVQVASFVPTDNPVSQKTAAAAAAGSEAPPFDLDAQLAEYDAKLAGGEVLAAHRLLSQLYWKHRTLRPQMMERLNRTASTIFFQPQPHFVDPHVIQPGDRLDTIASEYKVPWEYLAKLNRTDPKRIQAGKRLKVVRGPFSAVVELADYSLTVHLQGYYVRQFSVGIGRDGASPIGKFAVLNKVENPQYTDPDGRVIEGDDPHNPLGKRWIDLGNSYGIHGTIDPDSIGQASSRGCIRLRDADIVTVYEFLSKGSDVVIRR